MITATRRGNTTSMHLPSGRTVRCNASDPSTCGRTDRKTGRTHGSLWNNPIELPDRPRFIPAYDDTAAVAQDDFFEELMREAEDAEAFALWEAQEAAEPEISAEVQARIDAAMVGSWS